MQASDIPVIREEQYAICKQVIIPDYQKQVPEILSALHGELVAKRFKGSFTVNYNEGGVTNITSEQVHRSDSLFDSEEIEDESVTLSQE